MSYVGRKISAFVYNLPESVSMVVLVAAPACAQMPPDLGFQHETGLGFFGLNQAASGVLVYWWETGCSNSYIYCYEVPKHI